MVIPYSSLYAMACLHFPGAILVDALLVKFMFSPEYDIAGLVIKGEFCGVSLL